MYLSSLWRRILWKGCEDGSQGWTGRTNARQQGGDHALSHCFVTDQSYLCSTLASKQCTDERCFVYMKMIFAYFVAPIESFMTFYQRSNFSGQCFGMWQFLKNAHFIPSTGNPSILSKIITISVWVLSLTSEWRAELTVGELAVLSHLIRAHEELR